MHHDAISRLGCTPLIASASSPTLSPRTAMTWDPCAASSCYLATSDRKNQSSPPGARWGVPWGATAVAVPRLCRRPESIELMPSFDWTWGSYPDRQFDERPVGTRAMAHRSSGVRRGPRSIMGVRVRVRIRGKEPTTGPLFGFFCSFILNPNFDLFIGLC
jgi:hypothetical protein